MAKQQFIGIKEVLGVNLSDDKTPLGQDILTVNFADGTSQRLTKKTFDKIVSDTACDLTELRRRRVTPIVKEILVLLRESNLELGELEFMIGLLVQSVNENAEQASNKLWGVNSGAERTFLLIDEVLKQDGNDTK